MSDEAASCACSRVTAARKEYPGAFAESHRCVDCGAHLMRASLWSPAREQTAATILAALIQFSATISGGPPAAELMVVRSVALADALRAELAKVKS